MYTLAAASALKATCPAEEDEEEEEEAESEELDDEELDEVVRCASESGCRRRIWRGPSFCTFLFRVEFQRFLMALSGLGRRTRQAVVVGRAAARGGRGQAGPPTSRATAWKCWPSGCPTRAAPGR